MIPKTYDIQDGDNVKKTKINMKYLHVKRKFYKGNEVD